jgi:hypothetical protein
MIYESIRSKGGLVLVPSDALKQMNLGTVLGTKAYFDRSGRGESAGEASGPGDRTSGAGAEAGPAADPGNPNAGDTPASGDNPGPGGS